MPSLCLFVCFCNFSFILAFYVYKVYEMFCSLEANAGALTNFEVLDFLRSKGAANDSTRVLAKVAPSEYKVWLYSSQWPSKLLHFFSLLELVVWNFCGDDCSSWSYIQVYDYLVQSAACKQTRENINEFLERCKKYDLAKAELLNIINIRPSSAVEIYTVNGRKFSVSIVSLVFSVIYIVRSPNISLCLEHMLYVLSSKGFCYEDKGFAESWLKRLANEFTANRYMLINCKQKDIGHMMRTIIRRREFREILLAPRCFLVDS